MDLPRETIAYSPKPRHVSDWWDLQTTLKLLLGHLHLRAGQITVTCGGESAATRRLFSYIPQGNTLFSGTIADNVRMMRPDATDEEVQRALKAACAWDFVVNMEDEHKYSGQWAVSIRGAETAHLNHPCHSGRRTGVVIV